MSTSLFTTIKSIAVGLLVAVGSFVGYIVLSVIKGNLQLKDRGAMTPGRGDVLNRIDGASKPLRRDI